MEVLLSAVVYLMYRSDLLELKNSIFLELKNYSYTLEGERFVLDVVPLKENDSFYELMEDEKGLYILVQVPGVKADALRITYPAERYEKDVASIGKRSLLLFGIFSLFSMILSALFSFYALGPLRRALRLIEEVTRDIIHDLNTPIMTLLVNLKILSSKYSDEEITRAILSVKQLQSLKENLRPLMQERTRALKEIDVGEIIEDELSDLAKIYEGVPVEKELKVLKGKWDEEAVRRIFSNILENAFRHRRGSGPVRVRIEDRKVVVENPSQQVKNPGKVFERFYRESDRGTGLGLSIVKKFCTEMGWRVSARYEEGIFRVEVEVKEGEG